MAVISITATSIGPELISGIPQFVILTTNLPSTIFYTLDGSEPTTFSNVYLGTIEMPSDISVNLRALAISGIDIANIDITFNTDALPSYFISPKDGSGIVVNAYDVVDIVTDGYGVDDFNVLSDPVRSSDYELKDLDIKFSKTDKIGNPPGTMIQIGFPDYRVFNEEKKIGISHIASSPNNRNAFFNPKSLYITMDGRDGYQDTVYDGYKLINRDLSSTMDLAKYLGGKFLYRRDPYVSGGLVKSFFNREKGIMVSYYYDHNESRWIKSIQKWNKDQEPKNIGSRYASRPLVFTWVRNRYSMI